MSRSVTSAERRHIQCVAQLGCIIHQQQLKVLSLAEVHHLRARYGMGQRAGNYSVTPLCPLHHRTGAGIATNAGRKKREGHCGTEDSLLMQVELMHSGD